MIQTATLYISDAADALIYLHERKIDSILADDVNFDDKLILNLDNFFHMFLEFSKRVVMFLTNRNEMNDLLM